MAMIIILIEIMIIIIIILITIGIVSSTNKLQHHVWSVHMHRNEKYTYYGSENVRVR